MVAGILIGLATIVFLGIYALGNVLERLRRDEKVRKIVIDAVHAVEQMATKKKMTSEEKKALAKGITKDLCEMFHVPYNEKVVDGLIEAYVFLLFNKDRRGDK